MEKSKIIFILELNLHSNFQNIYKSRTFLRHQNKKIVELIKQFIN